MAELKLVQNEDLVTMMLGATGELVKKLQLRLKEWGFDPGAADGEFGRQTYEALQALQRKLGVEPTGELDAATTQAIEADLASANSVLKQRMNSAIIPVSTPAAQMPAAAAAAAPAAVAVPFYRRPIFWLGAAAAFMLLSRSSSGARSIDGVEVEDGEAEEVDEPEAADEPAEELGEAPAPRSKPKRKRARRRKPKAAKLGGAPSVEEPVPASQAVIDVEPIETHEEPAPPAEQE